MATTVIRLTITSDDDGSQVWYPCAPSPSARTGRVMMRSGARSPSRGLVRIACSIRLRRSLRLTHPHEQNRAGRPAQDAVRHTPEDEPPEAPRAMRHHRDQVRLHLSCNLDDDIGRGTGDNLRLGQSHLIPGGP